MQVNFFNVTQHGKIKATCFTCLICYAAFSDGKTNHKKINSAIRMSQLNIQLTHLNVEKIKKVLLLAKETYHFCCRSKSNDW